MQKSLILLLLLSISTAPVMAEVIIELSEDRLVAKRTESRPIEKPEAGFFQRGPEKGDGGGELAPVAILPWVIDDSDPFGNSTFFSVRNDSFGGVNADVLVTFLDASFSTLDSDFLTLSGNELVPYSVRAVPGLVTAPGVINRGIVDISSDGQISADIFDVDFGENFASGDRALTLADFCTDWRVRFLRFPGTEGGTVLTFLINGPLGSDEENQPTISGEVFSQSGTFINSFTLRTDDWILDLEALELVLGGTEFGSIVLELNTSLDPSGVVLEQHSACSQFSLGAKGACTDLDL